jgi:hypothetical protein
MTDPAPTLATAPTVEQVAAMACPVERARLLTLVSRTCGTLPGPLAEMRMADVDRALADGWKGVALADAIGLSKSRISQLSKANKARAAAGRIGSPAVVATTTEGNRP